MWRRLSFIDPSFCELYGLEPGIMRRLEGAPMQLKVRIRLMPSLSQHTTTLNFQRLPLLVGSSMR